MNWRQSATVALLLLVVAIVSAHPALAQSSSDTAAQEIIEKINAWRLSENTWPLKVNPTLQALALAQAEYLMTLPDIPDGGDVHLGRSGEGPKIRARQAPYNWPTYGRPEQIALDEIAYVGHNADAALGFWQSSSVHRTSALNPVYREIGVAAIPHRFGFLYIVVLGARPNVLPVTLDAKTGTLYLSNERFPGARGDEWIKDVAEVKLFDAEGKPMALGWRPWQPTIRLPDGTGNGLFVSFRAGSVEVISPIEFNRDQVFLPPAEATPTTAPPAVVVQANTPTPIPTPTANGGGGPSAAANISTPTLIAPAPTFGGEQDVTFIYDSRSLAIVNTSGKDANLANLELVHSTNVFPVTRWQTQWLAAPLETFPTGDCLQVWSWEESSDVLKPTSCRNQRGVILIAPEQRFWATSDFTVRWQGMVLTTCPMGAGSCTVDLPN